MRCLALRITAALAMLLAVADPAGAQAPASGARSAEKGRQWTLLIGVEKYQKARPLAFTGNDGPREDVASTDIGHQVKRLQRVVPLASSTGEEGSQIWDKKAQSLYTYWLNQGLKGHADADANGAVDVDELSNYVYKNVVRTSR